jgi:hypothetical protein
MVTSPEDPLKFWIAADLAPRQRHPIQFESTDASER